MTWERQFITEEVEHYILRLRELLVRHDENLAAWHLLDKCVPYWVSTPELDQAKADQREMCLHAIDPAEYETYYRENPHERAFEDQYGLDVAQAHRIPRIQWLRERLAGTCDPGTFRGIDLGSNDGYMQANLSLCGWTFDGVELHPGNVKLAKQRKQAFPKMGKVLRGAIEDMAPGIARYDGAAMFEVLEHAADPALLLTYAAAYVKPGGRLWVSTPNGAVEDGNLPNWAHVERKGHLWSFTPDRFHELLSAVGEVSRIDQGSDRVMVGEVVVGG